MDDLITKVKENWKVVLVIGAVALGLIGFRQAFRDNGVSKLADFLKDKARKIEAIRREAELEIDARREEEEEVLNSLERTKRIGNNKKRLEALIELRSKL